ncbi:Pyridoxamine 5'-phosphate oxidase-related FMN-binding protein [uncultured Pleomorphomonas sp.]|uniref:Pyridoxamine 5'-phosphate oxidase-related FMN-binding protein n=1 Tax=uncultured Pleomorphomonas sp. TaxID=442121 RepID=A0A212LGQ4_9HYPH|nr:pyridoxamine 5'-phosphate oxidase family protein [uncultured Pleomorphomonas sp.]SCM76670.1 Pyridoxamine 5'-phosphate oxidase-related FMN-binding protein [uncultured Pleomorphomonas sp.]
MDDTRFEAEDMARRILRSAATASLGTLTPDGGPFVTFVTLATDIDGAPLVLLSDLAAHTRHLARDGRASLLMQVPAGDSDDPLTGARATVVGRLQRVSRDEADRARLLARFLARHPEAEGYAGFGDFSIHRMTVEGVHLVAGFGRIARLAATDVLVSPAVANAFLAAEALLLSALNGSAAGPPMVAVDPDGVDVAGAPVRRLCFSRRAGHPGEVAVLLAELG